MKKVSIKDIARKAGVSHTTVSIVMNGKGEERKISKKMIDQVTKVADELNYRPNRFAISLRTGKTYTLGLIVDDISNFFFGHLAKSVEEEANRYGYTVMFCNSKNDEGTARNVLDSLLEKQMDGYIIAPTANMLPEIKRLMNEKMPVVLIDRFFQSLAASYVTLNNFKGAFDSVTHLVKQGYSRIALITNDTDQIQIRDRVEGYTTGLQKNGLPVLPELALKVPFSYSDQKIIGTIENFVKANKSIDSILFTSNNLGIPGLESLRNLGKKVATDIAVICFDDNDLFRLASPAITVVSQPIRMIGKNAVKILLEQMENRDMKEVHSVLPPNLIVRDSTPVRKNSKIK